jgi:hypothetical protein
MNVRSSTQVTTMTYEDICENCNRSLGHELCMSNRWHESSIKEHGSKVMLRDNIDSVTGMEQLNNITMVSM